jgi:DNA polymerase-3 subunit chi
MKKITIYFANDLYKTACLLTEKAYEQGNKILIIAENEKIEEDFNKLLWTYSKSQFIPHGASSDPLPEKQIIYISSSFENPNNATIIILMLHSNIEKYYHHKNFISSFERIILISDDKNLKILFDGKVEYYQQDVKNIWIKINDTE